MKKKIIRELKLKRLLDKDKKNLCYTCKNYFVSKTLRYQVTVDEVVFIRDRVTRETFFVSDTQENLNKQDIKKIEKMNFDELVINHKYCSITNKDEVVLECSHFEMQDPDRTYTPNERYLSVRIDCKDVQMGDLQARKLQKTQAQAQAQAQQTIQSLRASVWK